VVIEQRIDPLFTTPFLFKSRSRIYTILTVNPNPERFIPIALKKVNGSPGASFSHKR
jgi:hypothetical protein